MRRATLFGAVACLILSAAAPPAFPQAKPYRGAEYRTIATMTYGRFEVRMRSAQASGMLSSFFTYYDPANPWNEIDIEAMGRYTNEVQFNTIVPTQADNHVQRQSVLFNPHAAFHVYAIDWTPDYVAWRVDGVEVHRQTGSHLELLTRPQKLMMNIWQPSSVDWAGAFNPANLPLYAYYDWVKYYSYTPGDGDNFTLQWTDDFGAFDAARWQKATHSWNGNNSQFVQENVAFSDGYMILCLTDNQHSGYAGGAVVDVDVDPPYVVSAWASLNEVRVLFSEVLDPSSAQNKGNYFVPGSTVLGSALLQDGRTVSLSVSGLNPQGSQNVIVVNVKDTAGKTIAPRSVQIVPPLPLPIRINVGGPATSGCLGDSVWTFAGRYGAVGGKILQAPAGLDIAGTTEDSVFGCALEGLTFYSVRVPTDIPSYNVTLMLAETRFTSAGQRVFDVSVNGSSPLRVDVVQAAGNGTAWFASFPGISAPEGIITLYFEPVVDKTLLNGIIIESPAVGVEEEMGENGIHRLELDVFPNPFNGSAVFTYALPAPADVTFEIYDLLGRRVSAIPLGYRERGTQSHRWTQQGLASGVYLCSLSTGVERVNRRVLLLR